MEVMKKDRVSASAFIFLGLMWLLAMMILSRIGPPARTPLPFALLYLLGFILMIAMVKICPKSWTDRRVVWVILIIGICARLFFLPSSASNAIHTNLREVYWDTNRSHSDRDAPYSMEFAIPDRHEMKRVWVRADQTLKNEVGPQPDPPHVTEFYPPFITLLLRGWATVSQAEWTLRIGLFGFDFLSLILLVLLTRQRGVLPSRLMLYALNPLVLVFIAQEGYVPFVLTTSLFTGLYLLGTGRPLAGFFALGIATMSGYLAILVFPFVMTDSNRRAWWAALIPLLCLSIYLYDPSSLWQSICLFISPAVQSVGPSRFMQLVFGDITFLVLILFFLIGLGGLYLLEQALWKSIYFAVGFALFLLTALHPWHLLMIAPFMVFFPSKGWLFLMMTAVTSLLGIGQDPSTGHFRVLLHVKVVEYILFLAIIAYDCLRKSDQRTGLIFPPPITVSVVIPALNEADHIAQTIQSAKKEAQIMEIIVVDGGSVDHTRRVARQAGAVVMSGPLGRGLQISKGVAVATGDVIMVLHADAEIRDEAVRRMLKTMAIQSSAPGGAFGMDFKGRMGRIRIIAWLNNVRAHFFGISFGDQAQFFRKSALPAMNGFPDMLLMEDVELSFRMKALGRPLFVPKGVRVSQRRWEGRHFLDNALMVIRLFVRYLFRRRFYGIDGLNHYYYKTYYGEIQRKER